MEWYILKSVAILAVLLLFYRLLLEKENMHTFKRFYLLFAVIASVGIPLITLTTYVESASGNFEPVLLNFSEETSVIEKRSLLDYLPFILWVIYALGVIFFSLKFIRNLRELLLKIRMNPKDKKGKFTRVLLREKVDPHTFFSYIFLNRWKYEQEQIPREVIIHEEAHARQKHSLDILLVELLQIVFWMNPLIILLKDAVKLNHEFLADRAVIENGVQTAGYQNTLLLFSSGHLHSDLVNPINYSSIKKRFKVMKTHTSKSTIWTRVLLILPLISLLFFSFSNKEIVEREINALPAENINATTLILEVDKSGKVYFQKNETNLGELRKHMNNARYTSYHIEVADNSSPRIVKDLIKLMAENDLEGSVATCTTTATAQDKATPEMIAEYNRLVKNLNETGVIKQRDLDRIELISRAMTAEQKNNAVQPKYKIVPAKGDEIAKQVETAQQKATPEMIKEYNSLVKHYNALPKEEFEMEQEVINRIMYIRGEMTREQKEKAEKIIFDVPPPPPPAPAPAPEPAPQSPPAPQIKNVDVPPAPTVPLQGNMQAPPPPPPSPLESINDWIEEGAVFYYNGKRTTGKNILEIVQKNNGKNLQVQVQEDSSGKTVRISEKRE